MSESTLTIAHSSTSASVTRERAARLFLLALTLTLLAIVALGFSRTFFLRALFAQPGPLPAYLYVHGVALTLWYVWLVMQTSLVAAGRPDVHRRLGVAGAALAICMVVASLVVLVEFPGRLRAYGVDTGPAAAQFTTFAISSAFDVAKFAALVALAVVWRQRPALHKRLMLFASISVIGAVFSRMPDSLAGLGLSAGLIPFLMPMFLVVLFAGPFVYDLIARGRPHVVTVLCTLLQIATAAAAVALAANAGVQRFVLGTS
jgi:hypothetical protein